MICAFRLLPKSCAIFGFVLLVSGLLCAAPVITSLSPTSGASGTSVVISGTGFGSTQGSSTVKFGDVAASVSNWSSGGNSITATIPSGLSNGSVNAVVTVNGTASNGVSFTITNPVISNLSINSSPVDQEITINGSNFGSAQGTSTVTFNGVSAIPAFWSATSITVPVPTGATTGNVVVTVGGNASPGWSFMVTPGAQGPGVHFVQGDYLTPENPGATVAVQFPIEQTAGDLNAVIVSWRGSVTIQTVTDTSGNAYSLAAGPTAGSNRTQAIYFANNISGAATNTVAVTFSAAPQIPDIRVAEYSGLDTSNPVDVKATTSGTSTTSDSGLASTTNGNDVLIGANAVDGITNAAGSGYTNRVLTNYNNGDGDIFEDEIVTSTGSYHATATISGSHAWVMQMVAFKEAQNQAPVVNAGPNQTITLPTNTITLDGTATDDGLPNNTLTISWSKVSGPGSVTFTSPNTASTQATFSTAGVYVLQLTANDSQLSSSSNVTVTVNSQADSLNLSPSIAGPDVTGTTQTMAATLTIANTSTPISGASVQFTVTGPNATSGNATTDSTGTATFIYTGAHSGTDTIQASYTGQNSNTANVSWLVPKQPISVSTVLGRFFFPDNPPGFAFDILRTTPPLFTQTFPSIAFSPPVGAIPGDTTITNSTRPFTDVTMDGNGNFTGAIAAQGNGYQAGLGVLQSFEAVFTGTYTVASAGTATLTIYVDNSFILGVGGGATYVSGPLNNNPPSITAFQGYPVMAATQTSTGGFAIQINFPSAGTFPFELDYVECCNFSFGDLLSLVMMTGSGNNGIAPGMPPTGALTLSPASPTSLTAGQTQMFTVQAVDASGAPVSNLPVGVVIAPANTTELSGTTNAAGQATFQYSGFHAGTDSVQADANISGMMLLSNVATMVWTGASTGNPCTTYQFTPKGWISSPAIGAVVQGQVPISLASGITLSSGTLKFFPSGNPSQVTVLNSNTTGSGPLTLGTLDATLLANGEYIVQLQATNSAGLCQLNEIAVSVTGQNKPGRQTVTVTDLTVPLAGIPIKISRIYDSLNRGTVGDFGNGWNLDTNVQLSVDPLMNVTLTLNGKGQTFYFTPQSTGSALFPWLLVPAYTPQPGLFGKLTSNGCGALIQVGGALVQDTLGVVCFPGGNYQPTVYTYTDPSGRAYTISSTGQLQSIKDLNGNTLTFASTGITSSVNGIVIPFVRDGQNRITQITDLNGNHYAYSYDGSGNLQSVQYPGLSATANYTYASDHSLLTQQDPVGNSSTSTYDSVGRLQTFTDAAHNQWSYSYNVATNTTTTTNPDGGTVVETDDSFGKPLSITDPLNRKTTYTYDAKENRISMTDPLNNTTTYTYDSNGFQTSVTDPLTHKNTKTYNQFGGVLTATDAANTNTQTTTYDANFNPIQTTDLLNGAGTLVNSSTYDTSGNILTSTDANSQTTQFAYDPKGNLIQVTDPLNQSTRFTYDSMDRILSQIDPLNHTTQFTYDSLERLMKKTDALGKITSYTYDNNGNKLSETDANNHTTNYQYDALNRLTKITYPDTTTKQYTYDFRGNKLTEVDQLGRTKKNVYDLAGQLSSSTYAFGTSDAGTVSYTYDADGRQKTVKDELNNTTTNNYDAAGRLTSVVDALNENTSYGYDADNRKTSATDANTHTTSYAYDARSRLTKVTYNDTTTTQYTYDGMARLLTTTDQAAKVTTKAYDADGRLTSVKDALNNVTSYSYDANANLTFLQDAAGRVTSYQYDALNRRSGRTLPLNQAESYTYDPVGNLATHVDFNGLTTTYSYDLLNRLLSKVPSSGTGISYTYTATGQRATMTDPSGTTNYTYDNRDRALTKATPEGTLTYTYDAHGNVLTINSSNGNGASLTYTYDALNRLASAKDNRVASQGGPASPMTYSYDPAGNPSGYAYPNGVQMGFVFDTLNRLTQTCEAASAPACSAGTKLASYSYTLGASGNRTNVQELSSRNVGYGYDGDYRLTSEAITADPSGNNGTVNYVYDVVGNRASMTSTLNAVPGGSFFYDNNDRLTTDIYDANGNTTSSAGISNTYDFENRMLTHGGVTLVYDGDGNRVAESIGGATTKFLVDDHNPTGLPQVLDELVSGSVTRTYGYGLQRMSENQLVGSTWTPSYYGYDGHGNVRFLANSTGAITDSYDYDAFGMPIRTSGTTLNTFLYSGERLDGNIGLYDLRARYYNQASGRFWARDPVEGKKCCGLSWNPYIFVRQNPVNAVDPSGRDSIINYAIELGESREAIAELRGTAWIVQQEICIEETVAEWEAEGLLLGLSEEELILLANAHCLALNGPPPII